ncbi:2730_t:CDS:2 [Funneliformis geosporum]|uniref:2730_t:CDS:1 n=1 Tax=Funneliformis geosporum TaxID=1117311 RepID=A0A9W4SM39_9GLOM|nr:2730_t:CDS:2 [Funneliformis geosporum]
MSKNYSTHFVLWFLVHLLLIEINCQTAPFKPLRRESHTSTHIDDKLYILGGRNEAGDIKLTSAASVRGGINNKTLFLHGGFPYTENEVTLVYTFDTQSNSWSIPKITGDITIRKDNLKAIVDDNGKMYLFGGQSNETITNDMLILDTINLKWGIGASIDAPSPRADALYVLNLANYEWYIPKISGTIPGSRYWHQANVIGKYMIISFVNCQMTAYRPLPQYLHSVSLINDKLYFVGEYDFFSLDVSNSFSSIELKWNLLSFNNIIRQTHRGASSVKGGANNNTLFLYGGHSTHTVTTTELDKSPVYAFDPQSNLWSHPKTAGEYIDKNDITGVVNNNGMMHMFSNFFTIGEGFNDMLIFNTINFNLETKISNNAPSPRFWYGAVLLPNQKIAYLGGYNIANGYLPLNEIYLYDTINDNWRTELATGKVPSNRKGFTAILGLDGRRIIIFGGEDIAGVIPLDDSLYVLDLINFQWFIPKTRITGLTPISRQYHQANVVRNYMIVSFGQFDSIAGMSNIPNHAYNEGGINNNVDNERKNYVGANQNYANQNYANHHERINQNREEVKYPIQSRAEDYGQGKVPENV